MTVLIDLILLLILVVFVIFGWRRGLLRSLLSLVVLAACFVGAMAVEQALAPRAAEFLEPRITAAIEGRIETTLETGVQQVLERETADSMLSGVLGQFGVDTGVLAETAVSDLEPTVQRISAEISQLLAQKIAAALIFLLVFLILYLILHRILRHFGVMNRLPLIRTLNRAGGAVIGFLKGLLVVVIAAAVLEKTGLFSGSLGPLAERFSALASGIL